MQSKQKKKENKEGAMQAAKEKKWKPGCGGARL